MNDQYPQKNNTKIDGFKIIFLIILMIMTLGQMSSDIYLPSLPAITKYFSTTASFIQLTLASYLLGYSFSQLIYGPLSDQWGRRKPILLGLMIGVIGGTICLLAHKPWVLIIGRFIQGCGTGSGTALGRTVLRDMFTGSSFAKYGSLLMIGNTVLMASAPMFGGYIQHFFGWRMIFLILVVYTSIVILIVNWWLPETWSKTDELAQFSWRKNYILLMRSKEFMGHALCSLLAYAGIIAYLTAAPFLFQTLIGLTPIEFGWVGVLGGVSFIVFGFINSLCVVKQGIVRMMYYGTIMMSLGGILLLLAGLMGRMDTVDILLPALIFNSGAALIFANASAGAFSPFPKIAGVAGGLYGFLQIAGGALASALIAGFKETDMVPLASILLVICLLTIIALTIARDQKNKTVL